jgi:hypothetical protein
MGTCSTMHLLVARREIMRFEPISKCLLILLMSATPIGAQETQALTNWSPRVFLDADVGIRGELGFKIPSSDFGMSFEIPLNRRIEIQGGASYSPDKKVITHNGHSIAARGTGIFWINSRVGALGELDYGHLWTSQFEEGGTGPAFGGVIRTTYIDPGRLYISYSIPTGCVWATRSNPCKLQSKRLQGFNITQEFQIWPRVRGGFTWGIYHFCDQSNPNEPTIPRICHWAGTEVGFVRLEFPAWRKNGGKY